jgi:ABC-2 type transport system ATP-binding protein
MYGVSERDYRASMDLLSDVLGIDELLHVPVRQLSLGQRMRAELGNALLHDPDVLFLDEPTIGLDVEVKERIRQFIRAVNRERSTTVVLTTHDMSDVEKLCSRVIVIDHGRLMFDGGFGQLKRDYGADEKLIVDTDDPVTDLDALKAMGVTDVASDGNRLTLQYDRRGVNSADVLGYLMARHKVLNFVVRETETEAVIRNLYQANASLNQTR